jgi:twitching motility protein PilI
MEDVRSLRELRDRPYELLRELDRRARAASQGQADAAPNGAEWVGIAFRLGGEAFLLAREETREVMGYPAAVTRVPGARNWIRGLANLRGQLLPVIDVRAFLGSGATNVTRATRVLVANHREIPAGLVVDEVMGFRRFYEGEFSPDLPPTLLRCERYLAGAFKRGAEVWPVFSVRGLLESQTFMQAAAS